jgi:hypothetical protein
VAASRLALHVHPAVARLRTLPRTRHPARRDRALGRERLGSLRDVAWELVDELQKYVAQMRAMAGSPGGLCEDAIPADRREAVLAAFRDLPKR